MKTIVIFDSYFGNTEKVAKIVGNEMKARVVNVAEIAPKDLVEYKLIIFGSPTRAFRPTEKISKFLGSLCSEHFVDKNFAVFDTRMEVDKINNAFLSFMVKLFGYAARTMSKKIRKSSGKVIGENGFIVADTKGPLKIGEEERAINWAKKLENINK